MKYHQATEKIRQILAKKGIWYETFEHEAVRTSQEAAKIRPGYTLTQGAKALVFRIRKAGEKFFVMLVLPGDQRFDNEKAKKLFGAKDIRFAAEEEVGQITNGIKLGGVPPFGNLFGLKTYVDPSLMKNEKIVFNAGDQRFSIAMKAKDYIELLNAEITNFV